MAINLRELRAPLIVSLTGLALGLGGGGAWSVWSEEVSTDPVVAGTGVLDIASDQAKAYWVRSTDGYTGASYLPPCGNLDGSDQATVTGCKLTGANQVVTMPGDTFDYVMPVTTSLAGNNLAAGFSIAIEDAEVLAAVQANQLAVEFYVATPASEWGPMQRVAPPVGQAMAQVGQVVSLPGTVPGSATLVSDYLVVAHVTVLGNYAWDTDFSPSSTGEWSANAIDFDLVQIRSTAVAGGGN